MEGFATDWLNLLLRWAHLAIGIGWIGTSFYFVALDYSLRKREGMKQGVLGTAWEVHGGGFYHVEKFTVAPPELPTDLIWYRWEAYLTWVTGFGLLVVQYYWHASTFLIDPAVQKLMPSEAVIIGAGSLAVGWLVYNALVKALLERPLLLAAAVFALILGAAWCYGQVFSGRGAFIHAGAFIGTIMAANVFMVIIPNQRKIVEALLAGEVPDPAYGKAGKQRSLHNNYLTLPVLLLMLSNHYPFVTGHPHGWLVVALIVVVGGSIRHIINRHDAGDDVGQFAWAAPAALAALIAAVVITAPDEGSATAEAPPDAKVIAVVSRHCAMCHAERPTHAGITEAPKNVKLESLDELKRHGVQVLAQAVQTRTMPLGNETGMTDAERAMLGAWIRANR